MTYPKTKARLGSLFMTIMNALEDGNFSPSAAQKFIAETQRMLELKKISLARARRRKLGPPFREVLFRGTTASSTEVRSNSNREEKSKNYKYVYVRAGAHPRTPAREEGERRAPRNKRDEHRWLDDSEVSDKDLRKVMVRKRRSVVHTKEGTLQDWAKIIGGMGKTGRPSSSPRQTNRPRPQLRDAKERCSLLEEKFRERPRLALAREAYEVVGEFEGEQQQPWTWLAVMGMYLTLWEETYDGHKWAGNVTELYREIRRLGDKLKLRDVVHAIAAVFSKDLAWVKSDPLGFIANEKTYTKYVVPVVASVRRVFGEQAEWSGERLTERKAKKVKL